MEERQDYRVFWILVVGLLLLSRSPAMTTYLSIDNVNLAFALENFDPRIHQPQPPGYPLFVGFARVLNFGFRDAERTFAVVSLLISALCLPVAFALGRRMFSTWAAAAGTFLLLVNPVFWFSGIEGPLRPFLALFSLLTAYCCWRCWNGEKQFAVWGAVALGIGSGFRPDLIAFLFPIWLISTWVGTKSFRSLVIASSVLGAIILAWAGALVVAMGGFQTFMNIMLGYVVEQSPESMVFGNPLVSWLKQMSRLIVWNGLAIVTWIWVLPLVRKNPGLTGNFEFLTGNFEFFQNSKLPVRPGFFFFIWVIPGLIVQALIHVAAPGHALASVVALCVLGGYVLSLAPRRDTLIAPALILNAMLFLGFFSLPVGVTNAPDEIPSLKNAMLFGAAETSITLLRSIDQTVSTSLKEIREFTPKDRPSIIMTTDTYKNQFFMNWRVARYYLPDRDIRVIYQRGANHGVEHVRRDAYLGKVESTSISVPIPAGGRILWLIEPQGELHQKLSGQSRLAGGQWVFYTDVEENSPPIQLDGIQLVPSLISNQP